MIIRICISIHNWRPNRNYLSKLINWYYPSWYLLRSSPLSLCSIYGCSICYHSRIYSLIPFIYRINNKPQMIKNTIYSNIHRSKLNILPSTLLRISWNTTSIFWLSRRLYLMKYFIIIGFNYFINWNYYTNFHYMRKNNFSPKILIPHEFK